MNTSFSNHTTVTSNEVSLQPLGVLTDVVAECVADERALHAVEAHADAIDAGDHRGVIEAAQRLLPTHSLRFLAELNIEPTLASLRQAR